MKKVGGEVGFAWYESLERHPILLKKEGCGGLWASAYEAGLVRVEVNNDRRDSVL